MIIETCRILGKSFVWLGFKRSPLCSWCSHHPRFLEILFSFGKKELFRETRRNTQQQVRLDDPNSCVELRFGNKRKSVSTTTCSSPWSLEVMHFHDHLSGYSERLHYWLETNSLFRISVSLWIIAKNRLENRDFIITILLLPPNPWIQYFAFRQHNLTHSVSRVEYVKLH